MVRHSSGTHALTPSTIVIDPYHWVGYAILWRAVTTANWVFSRDTLILPRKQSQRAYSYPLLYQFHTEDAQVYTAEVGAVTHLLSNQVGLKCRVRLFDNVPTKTAADLQLESSEKWREHADLSLPEDSLQSQLVAQMPKQPMYLYPAAIQENIKALQGNTEETLQLTEYPITAFFLTEFNPYLLKETRTHD